MVQYDPFSDDVIYGDKYAVYRALRDEAPQVRFAAAVLKCGERLLQ